jgi:hypothetical protein
MNEQKNIHSYFQKERSANEQINREKSDRRIFYIDISDVLDGDHSGFLFSGNAYYKYYF